MLALELEEYLQLRETDYATAPRHNATFSLELQSIRYVVLKRFLEEAFNYVLFIVETIGDIVRQVGCTALCHRKCTLRAHCLRFAGGCAEHR